MTYSEDSPFSPTARITVAPDPISINGSVLPTAKIHYGNPAASRPVQPRNGSWNMIYESFHKPKALLSWGILNYSRVSDQMINRFINTLLNACRKIGAIRLFIFCASQTNLSIVGMTASQSCASASSVVNVSAHVYMQFNYFKRTIYEFGGYALTGKEEIEEIKGAIDDVWQVKGLNPELTFIVVGKW
ncbi:uncharacterized protein EDB93DRAFT_1258856 [Suillus bovinus]|uniref:uncharacterized protein n=1 Tax=Suillus bovinus TaxID=48563 RepID=UPI001B86B991|nr:uncharacterized protein EDB93DRAFT_1258856 [Suillus bovinus]KAG2124394.1 hypothetical protein EDB93DRAFT_1258856 [Suillus bovinus]